MSQPAVGRRLSRAERGISLPAHPDTEEDGYGEESHGEESLEPPLSPKESLRLIGAGRRSRLVSKRGTARASSLCVGRVKACLATERFTVAEKRLQIPQVV